MKNGLLKLLTAVVLVFAMTFSVCATGGDYFDSPKLDGYDEKEVDLNKDYYQEIQGIQAEGEGAGQNNYYIYAIETGTDALTAQGLLDSLGENYETEFKAIIENQFKAAGKTAVFDSFSAETEKDAEEFYSYANIECAYTVTNENGEVLHMYQEIAIIPADGYNVYVTVTNVVDAEECKDVLAEIMTYIWVDEYNIFNEDILGEDLGEYGNTIMGLSIAVVVVFFILILLVPVAIIVIIVVLVRSSKKKKAMRAQQNNPYGYNPYAVPQQPYNPNAPQQTYGNGAQQPPYGQNTQQPPYGNGTPQQPYGQPPMPSYMQPPVQPQPPVEAPAEITENSENNSENLDN